MMKCICGKTRLHFPMIYFLLITADPALGLTCSTVSFLPSIAHFLLLKPNCLRSEQDLCLLPISPSPYLYAPPLMCCLCDQTAVCL